MKRRSFKGTTRKDAAKSVRAAFDQAGRVERISNMATASPIPGTVGIAPGLTDYVSTAYQSGFLQNRPTPGMEQVREGVLGPKPVPFVPPPPEPPGWLPRPFDNMAPIARYSLDRYDLAKIIGANRALEEGNVDAAEWILKRKLTNEEISRKSVTPETTYPDTVEQAKAKQKKEYVANRVISRDLGLDELPKAGLISKDDYRKVKKILQEAKTKNQFLDEQTIRAILDRYVQLPESVPTAPDAPITPEDVVSIPTIPHLGRRGARGEHEEKLELERLGGLAEAMEYAGAPYKPPPPAGASASSAAASSSVVGRIYTETELKEMPHDTLVAVGRFYGISRASTMNDINLIDKILEHQRTLTTGSRRPRGRGLPRRRYVKGGRSGDIDMEKSMDRIKVLVGSIESGNDSMRNKAQLSALLDYALLHRVIDKALYKEISRKCIAGAY